MKKITKALVGMSTGLSLFLTNPVTALAANTDIDLTQPGDSWNGIANLKIGALLSGLVRIILVVASLLFFFTLVIGGVQWIVSGGDKAGSENARKKITSALVGLAIVFAAWAITALISNLFGIDILKASIAPIVK